MVQHFDLAAFQQKKWQVSETVTEANPNQTHATLVCQVKVGNPAYPTTCERWKKLAVKDCGGGESLTKLQDLHCGWLEIIEIKFLVGATVPSNLKDLMLKNRIVYRLENTSFNSSAPLEKQLRLTGPKCLKDTLQPHPQCKQHIKVGPCKNCPKMVIWWENYLPANDASEAITPCKIKK
jgi:hypothetical protein